MDRREIARQLEQIELRLAEIFPTRTGVPPKYVDLTGTLYEAFREEWDQLWEQKHRLEAMFRQGEGVGDQPEPEADEGAKESS